ncbi:bifunctional hydroxymethylpyrimidine kinase/phosphomethylpyrimidine kinase [Cupriavidus basilensis]
MLLKGGHLDPEDPGLDDLLLSADGTVRAVLHPRVDTRNLPGTGCTLAAAITAQLARGDYAGGRHGGGGAGFLWPMRSWPAPGADPGPGSGQWPAESWIFAAGAGLKPRRSAGAKRGGPHIRRAMRKRDPPSDAKRAVKVYQAVWGASGSDEKSGKEGPMFEYRLKAMRVWVHTQRDARAKRPSSKRCEASRQGAARPYAGASGSGEKSGKEGPMS